MAATPDQVLELGRQVREKLAVMENQPGYQGNKATKEKLVSNLARDSS